MYRILLFLLLLSINFGKAQNYIEYHKLINEAEILSLDKNFQKADSLYQNVFSIVKRPFNEDYLFAGLNAEKMDKNEKTYLYFKKGIQQGLNLKRIKSKTTNFKKSSYWKTLQKEYKSLNKEFLHSIDISLKNQIKEMINKDQKVRNPIFGSAKKMKKTDTQNFIKLKNLIKENGNKWLGFSTIGEISPKGKYDVTDNIVLLTLHFTKNQVEELKPFMLEAVLNGEMYPYQYARVLDYTLENNKEKVVQNFMKNEKVEICFSYGTYLNSNICDCDKAENLRKKIGFEPIKDFYRKVNSNYRCLK